MRRKLLVLGVLGIAVLGALAGVVLGGRLLGRPGAAGTPAPDPGAGLRFQGVVAQLLLRQGGLSGRDDPLVVSAPDLSAFLSRHLDARRFPVHPVVVRVGADWVEVVGQTSARQLAASGGRGNGLVSFLPGALLDLDVWLGVRGRVRFQRGLAELVVEGASIGRQPVSPRWVWRLLGVGPGELLAWRLPRIVEGIDLAPGRIVVHTRRRAARDPG